MPKLKCAALNYAWGKYPPDSEVARLFAKNSDDEAVDESKPYAEFWMGTHPNGPSLLKATGETLEQWIEAHPEALGETVRHRFSGGLPFLFKVLSVRTALSIQSHPDKRLAEQLHNDFPDVYKDPNHKPEMAIALNDFEALCQFAPFDEISLAFDLYPEIKKCIRQETVEKVRNADDIHQKEVLREAFTELMLCSAEVYSGEISAMVERLKKKEVHERTEREVLMLTLQEQYPNDIGIFASCFLNHVRLAPGEAIYLAANEPHAYLKGDLVECMATSDNVIRAGLTPKLRDTAVLCNSLSYKMGGPDVLKGEKMENGGVVYRPPFEEFEVRKIALGEADTCRLSTSQGPSIVLVHEGTGEVSVESNIIAVTEGDVYFVPAGASVTVKPKEASSKDLLVWQATVNRAAFEDP